MLRHFLPRSGVALLVATAAAAALAQTAATSATPVTPAAATPGYRSAFDGYRPYVDEQPADWKGSNESVRQAGGWRAYAREAATPAQPAASSPGVPPGSTDPHSSHHKP